jgi:cyclopropane fatty-acyl-phospholipid synthase-like methyltransferase
VAAPRHFHGLEPAPIAQCRVLELGCRAGGNLLPMAATLPEVTLAGRDLSPRAIDAAGRAVAER